MSKKKPNSTLTALVTDSAYHPDAFEFLREGLDYTVNKTHGSKADVVRNVLRWLQEHQAELSQLPSLLSRGEIPDFIVAMIREMGDLEEATDQLNLHVSGEELCHGLRDLAMENWGLLAQSVLHHWGIRSTKDFGKMVFELVDRGLLAKQPDDSIDDFNDVYDFDSAFNDSFRIDIRSNANSRTRKSGETEED